MQIDHLFIRARPGAPEAGALAAFGLAEGGGNRHPGQGTANRRFFFHNAFLELLWLDDAAEAQSAATRPTMLYERLSVQGAEDGGPGNPAVSPFGVCLRSPDAGAAPPFAGWRYQPAYFPPGVTCDIAPGPLSAPMWFHIAPGGRPDAFPPGKTQPLAHRVPLREITAVTVVQPSQPDWPPAPAPHVQPPVASVRGEAHLLEITFDGGVQGQSHDFRPVLPLVFKY